MCMIETQSDGWVIYLLSSEFLKIPEFLVGQLEVGEVTRDSLKKTNGGFSL